MSAAPWLVMFDIDGTLVDSQHEIAACMATAFVDAGLEPPAAEDTRGIIGLSLSVAIRRLAPELDAVHVARVVEAYKDQFLQRREDGEERAGLFDGARAALARLNGQDHLVLGAATGKAMRGLDHVIEVHDLAGLFVTKQTADLHPSKPHPAMLRGRAGRNRHSGRELDHDR